MLSPYRQKSLLTSFLRSLIRSYRLLLIKLYLGRSFTCGSDVVFGRSFDLRPPNYLRISDRVGIGKNFTLESDLIVGTDVLISSNVSVVGNDHRFDDPLSTVYSQGRFPESLVIIEGDNLIGYGVVIVGNVRIGKGCIVGAGSVVVNDLPSYSICAGIPARFIKNRYE